MRPQQLHLKNFGPFIDETIDFTHLTEAALFLISGNTGTGKTTIFDGIMYALFGETSGGLRSGKEMRSSFALPEAETAVTFVFEHQGLLYRLERKPEQFLAKKRGSGERKQGMKIALTICQLDGKELRQYTKRVEVDQQIKELLHLDAKQFAQIVLLPQGEFRTFLIAKSDEKEKVLRHLFGTQIFQQFAEGLRERVKSESRQLEQSCLTLDMLRDGFNWETEIAEVASTAYPAFIQAAETQVRQQHNQVAVQQEQLQRLEAQQQQAEKAFYQAQNTLALFSKRRQLQLAQEQLLAQAAVYQQRRQRAEVLEWAQQQQPLVAKLAELEVQKQQLQEKQQELQLLMENNQQAADHWQQAADGLAQQTSNYEQDQERLRRIEVQLPLAVQLAEQLQEKDRLEQQQILQRQQAQQIAAELTELHKQIGVSQQQLEQQGQLLQRLPIIALGAEQARNWQQATKQKGDLEQQLLTQREKLRVLQQAAVENREWREERITALRLAKSVWAKVQIARLSLDLLDGEPCPVCGSLEHPQKHTAEQPYSKAEILAAEQKVEALELEVAQFQEVLAKNTAQQEYSEQRLEQLQKEQAAAAVAEVEKRKSLQAYVTQHWPQQDVTAYQDFFTDELAETQRQLAALAQVEEQLAVQQSAAEQLEVQLTEQQQRELVLERQLAQLMGAVEGLQKQGVKGTAAELAEEQQELQERIKAYQEEQKRLVEQQQELAVEAIRLTEKAAQVSEGTQTNQVQLQQQEAAVAACLAEAVVPMGLAELQGYLQEVQELPALRREIADYDQQLLLNQQQQEDTKAALLQQEKPEMAVYEAALQQAKQAVGQAQEELASSNSRWQQNRQRLTDFAAEYQKNQQQLEAVSLLTELSDTMSGKTTQKISIERYVLQTYLQEVLQVANLRLGQLTRNRYQFELSTTAGSYRNQTGLEINVYDDDAGSSRSAHTLSGGESFIAALALALSLAEVIQSRAGGIAIEALFIDEGFGSLDEESLNMAMEALETIESEGRMIGVISHVRELKERVPQQILVLGSGSGQSTIAYQR